IAALTLDDLHWRDGWLRVPRCKTRSVLHLPLTDGVGAALVHYLRAARPPPCALPRSVPAQSHSDPPPGPHRRVDGLRALGETERLGDPFLRSPLPAPRVGRALTAHGRLAQNHRRFARAPRQRQYLRLSAPGDRGVARRGLARANPLDSPSAVGACTMNTRPEFASPLAPVITRYLDLMIALGRGYATERRLFHVLDAFLVADHAAELTP